MRTAAGAADPNRGCGPNRSPCRRQRARTGVPRALVSMPQAIALSRLTEWVFTGHHPPIPSVKIRNASGGGTPTVIDFRIGSTLTSSSLPAMFLSMIGVRGRAERIQDPAPEPIQVGAEFPESGGPDAV